MKSLFISIIVSVVFLSMMVGCKNRTDETFLNTIQKTRIYIPYKKYCTSGSNGGKCVWEGVTN